MSIKFRGTMKVTNRMRRSAGGAQSGAARASRVICNQILKESQVLVPVRTGNLKASGRVIENRYKFKISFSIAYGSQDSTNSAKYAVYVHEDLNMPHMPPTQAKFLEIPWRAAQGEAFETFKVYVGSAIDKAVRT